MRISRRVQKLSEKAKDAVLTRDWFGYEPGDEEGMLKSLGDLANIQGLFDRKNVKYRLPLVGVGGVTGLVGGDLVGEKILEKLNPKSTATKKGILWGSRIAGTSAGVLGGDLLGKRIVRGAAKRTIGLDVKK